jgi:outer membrane protein assembly factor BamE
MQMLPLHSRLPAGGALCVALAMLLGGCASKNPLMEEPTPVASKAKPAAETQVASAQPAQPEEAKPAAVTAAPAAAPTASATPSTPAPAAEVAPAAASPQQADASTAKAAGGVHVEHKKRFLGIFSPYRPDIQQGNFVSQEMVAQLKVGMTPDQVIFLMGTPLLNDVFHGERWDYPFRMQKGNGEITTSSVTVYFENNRVSRIEGGGDLPTEADYLARIANKAKQKK